MQWWELLNLNPKVANLVFDAEKSVTEEHNRIDEIVLFNQAKVLKSFCEEKITEDCFNPTDGYGYHDHGRDKLEALFINIFKAEDAIVRPHFVSGTHTLFTSLKGLLRPGDRLISVTGTPYDTLHRCIVGNSKELDNEAALNEGNLIDWGISYAELQPGQIPHTKQAIELLKKPTKVILIQRSRGYDSFRNSLTIEELATLIGDIRSINPEATIFVDNCYGEFVQEKEPLEVGADVVAGSLIKNPGGGLAPSGGYIVGKKEYISRISNAFSAPGLGKELGAFINKKPFYQGLFMAPHIVGEALKGVVTIARVFEYLGYEVSPKPGENRGDIVQAIHLNNEDEIQRICHAVQGSSPVNSHLLPEPGPTAGYTVPIFMAAGTFVQGASIELSADAPLKLPFSVYIQGGLSYEHIVIGLAHILDIIT